MSWLAIIASVTVTVIVVASVMLGIFIGKCIRDGEGPRS